jgi:hypothetical protein
MQSESVDHTAAYSGVEICTPCAALVPIQKHAEKHVDKCRQQTWGCCKHRWVSVGVLHKRVDGGLAEAELCCMISSTDLGKSLKGGRRVVRKDWLNQQRRQRQEEEAGAATLAWGVGGVVAVAEAAASVVALADTCMVCVSGPPVPFMPCGHAVLCWQCSADLLNAGTVQCHICQSLVAGLG